MTWEKNVIRRVLEVAGDCPGAMLQMLLKRLEHYPDAVPAIAEAVEEMAAWHEAQANALKGEIARREANAKLREIVNTTPK